MSKIMKNGRMLLGWFLLAGMAVSCTKDYFLDENNYWIYVPQIKERSIQDFYIAFHDADGNHLRTSRFSAADFNQSYVTNGLIRSKLKSGETNVMCFAQLNTIEVTEGQPLALSYLALPVEDAAAGIYVPAHLDCRMFQKKSNVLPIGHPEARIADTVDMKEDLVYLGYIELEFRMLPSEVDKVVVSYGGLATRMSFDGSFTTFTPDDRVRVAYTPEKRVAATQEFRDSFLPSAGTLLAGNSPDRTPLRLEVIFYDKEGQQMGYLTENDLAGKHPVTDGNGKPVEGDIFLEPRSTIRFAFEGFTMVGIQLLGWGGIDPGETTPTAIK